MSKKKNSFILGPISPTFIATSIEKHQPKTDIGAHQIFLGQVRRDKIKDAFVEGIEYTSHQEMAEEIMTTASKQTVRRWITELVEKGFRRITSTYITVKLISIFIQSHLDCF